MTLFNSVNPSLKEFGRAVVVENRDPESRGRIRLEYPWLGKSSAKLPSEWARLCLPYASKQHGMNMIPEIGDEVLVFFDNGNIESPIVMGTLYNEKNLPALSGRGGDSNSDNKNNLRFIKSRSGHLLCFDDSEDNGGFFLNERDGACVELNSAQKLLKIKDSSGNTIELKGSEISIKNKEGSKIVLNGSKITIEASGSIELGEGASESLVKGESFMQLFNAHTHTVGPATSTPPTTPMNPALLSKKVKTG